MQRDGFDLPPFSIEVFARAGRIGGCDAQRSVAGVMPAHRCGHRHRAATEAEVVQFVDVGTGFQEHVASGDADIRDAMLDVDSRIRWFHQEVADVACLVLEHEPASLPFERASAVRPAHTFERGMAEATFR